MRLLPTFIPASFASCCALALAGTFAGCASVHTQHAADEAVPENWGAQLPAQARTVAPESWVATFEDPLLIEFINEALQHNYNLKAAASRREAALSSARIAGASGVPTLGLSADAARSRTVTELDFLGSEQTFANTDNRLDVRATASWEIDLWGELRAGRSAALADAQAAEALYRGAKLSLQSATAQAYFGLQAARGKVLLASKTQANRQSALNSTQGRYENGTASIDDVRLARTAHAQAKAELEIAQHTQGMQARALEVLLGRYPSEALLSQLPALDILPVPPENPWVPQPAELLTRRPDVAQAAANMRAAGWRLKEAKAARLPGITLSANLGRTGDETADLMKSAFSVWNLAGQLAVPIFQGGQLKNNQELNVNLANEARAAYGQTVLEAYEEAENAIAAQGRQRAATQLIENAAREAMARAESAHQLYKRGLTQLNTSLNVEESALQLANLALDARLEQLLARIQLHLALADS